MEKEQVIQYIEGQISKIDQPDFDLESWKGALTAFFDQIFGRGNAYSTSVRSLSYIETISYEELYPRKIRDEKTSHARFKKILTEVKEQLALLDEGFFEDSADKGQGKGAESFRAIIAALHNNLTGRQLSEIKSTASGESQAELNYLIRRMDAEILQNLLGDILSCKEIWENIE